MECFSLRKGLLESEEDSITHTLQRSERTSFAKTKRKIGQNTVSVAFIKIKLMKKFNKRIFFFLVSMVAVVALLSSCDKSDETSIIPSREGRAPDEQSASVSDAEFANLRAGSTYSSTPSVGGSIEGDLSSLFIY